MLATNPSHSNAQTPAPQALRGGPVIFFQPLLSDSRVRFLQIDRTKQTATGIHAPRWPPAWEGGAATELSRGPNRVSASWCFRSREYFCNRNLCNRNLCNRKVSTSSRSARNVLGRTSLHANPAAVVVRKVDPVWNSGWFVSSPSPRTGEHTHHG